MTAQNLALQLLEDQGESTDEYDGMCGELVDGIIHWLGEDRVSIMHVDAHDNDLRRFLKSWVAATGEFCADSTRYLPDLMQVENLPPDWVLAGALVAERE